MKDIKLLHTWEQAHRTACNAERLAIRPNAYEEGTLRALHQSAREWRAYADASFRLLLETEAFGELEDMPLTRGPARNALGR
ncbi:MAG: hypothetical protein ACJ8GO_12555 [Ramlibacter sp.]